ncbi:MAG: hypothetical protein IEMM0002_1032 [bacterium]|nr:MAG: hypothetical protein IEMM0002_1032 [bacterium]
MIGVTWMIAVFPIYLQVIRRFLGVDPGLLTMVNGGETYPYIILGIATVHSGFNITNATLFIPFIGYMEKLLVKLVPMQEGEEKKSLTRLESAIIETPVIALEHSNIEIINMGNTVTRMMDDLKTAIGGETINDEAVEKVFQDERDMDIIQNEVSIFLTGLLASGLPHEVTEEGRQQIRMADEYESISDYIVRILKLYLRLRDANLTMPKEEKANIYKLHKKIFSYVEMVNDACESKKKDVLREAHPQSSAITNKIRLVRTQHLERLSDVRMDPLITMIFTDMINAYRRVKDHALNIAEAIAGEK